MPLNKTVEIAVGTFIALGLIALLVLALKVSGYSNFSGTNGYVVTADFDNVGSLKVRAPVTVAGVKVGQVVGIKLDPQSYQADVSMALNPAYPLPKDTSASIVTAGLLGEQYVSLDPGGSEQNLKAGDVIKLTQPALVLEKLIGQFLFNAAGGKQK